MTGNAAPRVLRRRLVALVAAPTLATVAAVGWPAPAGALPILAPEDAGDLMEVLADASEAHGICYGWEVSIFSESGSSLGEDIGSNIGVGVPAAGESACPRWMVFEARLTYTSESSEASDKASFAVLSNVPEAPTTDDLRRVGVSGDRLLGANDDAAVADATRALPLLAAENGIVDALPLEVNAEPLPEGDSPTGSHGSDWRREYGAPLLLGVVLVLVGIGWILFTLLNPTLVTGTPEQLHTREQFE